MKIDSSEQSSKEKKEEGAHLGKNTLGRVELVPADDDLLTRVHLPQRLDLGKNTGGLTVLLDVVDVDTDRAVGEVREVSVGVDAVGAGLVTVDAHARREEVAGVGVRLEADEVATEHPVEDLLAAGEAAEELGRGEGTVEEEGDDGLLVGEELAEHLGDEEKVVVVDPDLRGREESVTRLKAIVEDVNERDLRAGKHSRPSWRRSCWSRSTRPRQPAPSSC